MYAAYKIKNITNPKMGPRSLLMEEEVLMNQDMG
jgi:hypothetical protein